MEEYYRRRAKRYEEEFYQGSNNVRQRELGIIAEVSRNKLRDRRVLDVACGTGYWTQIASETARCIVGTDIAQEMLEIAKTKKYDCPVSFCKGDAYCLSFQNGFFNGGLANFWFSHIPKSRIRLFLKDFHRLLQRKSTIFMADNVAGRAEGLKKGDNNTYQLRKLQDGSEHLVLKNYFSVDELIGIFGKYDRRFSRENVFYGKYFWYLFYELQ
jgi:ubiquinone/menaquinone biosynthesis C-methylase UbiE